MNRSNDSNCKHVGRVIIRGLRAACVMRAGIQKKVSGEGEMLIGQLKIVLFGAQGLSVFTAF